MNIAQLPRFPVTIEQETVLIGTAAELCIALDVLHGQYDRAVLSQLRPHLGQVIARAKDFLLVSKSLSTEDQRYLIEALGPRLPAILEHAAYLRDILASLSDPQVEVALLRTLGTPGLRSLIRTGAELADVLEWVYGQCDALVLDSLGYAYVARLCREAADLSDILRSLDSGLQEQLLGHLGWEFTLQLVRTGRDLADLLRALPAPLSSRLLRHYTRAQLQTLIADPSDWEYLYRRLDKAEAAHIARLLKLS